MSDWRTRATPVDPMSASRAAIQQQNSVAPELQNPNQTLPPAMDIRMTADPAPVQGGWRSRAIQAPVAPVAPAAPAAPTAPTAPTAPQQGVGGWRSRATQAPAAPSRPSLESGLQPRLPQSESQGLGQKLDAAFAQRDAAMQENANLAVDGGMGVLEMSAENALENASKLPDAVFTTAGHLLTNLPTVAGKDIGGTFQKGGEELGNLISQIPFPGDYADTVVDAADRFAEENPNATRRLKAVGQGVNILGTAQMLRSAGNAVEKRIPQKPLNKPDGIIDMKPRLGTPELREVAAKNTAKGYAQADKLNQAYSADQVGNKIEVAVRSVKPALMKNGQYTVTDDALNKVLSRFEGHSGKTMTLRDVDQLDKNIGNQIAKFVDNFGNVDANGRKLLQLQSELRKAVDAVPDNPAYAALSNGRAFYQAERKLQDLERVSEWASLAKGHEASALQSGYARLAKQAMKKGSGWTKEEVALLKKAVKPGMTTKLIAPITNKLFTMFMGVSHGPIAGAGAHTLDLAAKGWQTGAAVRRGAKVGRQVLQTAVDKSRAVTSVQKPAPLRLSAPDKMTPLSETRLPMSDKRVTISQKLMSRGNTANTTTSGGATKIQPTKMLAPPDKMTKLAEPMRDGQVTIAQKLMSRKPQNVDTGSTAKPPVSQLVKLQNSLGKARGKELRDLFQILTDGDMSQNQFVKDVTSKFGLTATQARSLAKEVQTHGTKTPEILDAGKLPK